MTLIGYVIVQRDTDGTYDTLDAHPLFEIDDRQSAQDLVDQYGSDYAIAEVHLALAPEQEATA